MRSSEAEEDGGEAHWWIGVAENDRSRLRNQDLRN